MALVTITNPTILNTETADVTKLTQNDNDLVNGITDGTKDININQGTIAAIVSACIPPVGSIIPFYDFNAGLTFNSSNWAYCDGSAATIAGLGAQTLPDLSNRYLVGFGTEGGGDIDTAAWATAAVGNASHQVDLSHTHNSGTLQFSVCDIAGYAIYFYQLNGDSQAVFTPSNTAFVGGSQSIPGVTSNTLTFYTKDGTGVTGSGGSATQTIQPRSIRVRFIMRIL